MPLININSTNNTQSNNQSLPNQDLQPVVTNFKAVDIHPVAPSIDIKASLDEKLGNLPNPIVQEELTPLSSVNQLQSLQNSLSQVTNSSQQIQPQLVSNIVEQSVPQAAEENLELDRILELAIKRNASDVHFTSGNRVLIRVDGKLEVASSAIVSPELVDSFVVQLLLDRPDVVIKEIKEFDLTYKMGLRRFRVNIFRQMGTFSITLRVIPERILTLAELGLPEILNDFPSFPNGLVLLTGPTGSGKSTTIAAILNQINLTYPKHIVTLEDPIEFVFPKGVGLVDQREFGIDFDSWDNALRSVLRQDPDVVLVGEMRDLETVEAALQIAETGHLVFATLHTNGAAETINRVIDVFDSNKQDQIRVQLSSVLRAVVSQRLIPVSTGGRRSVVEILLSTAGVKNAIRDKKTFQINNIIQTNSEIGMISMEKSLVRMVRDGLITKEVAKSLSLNPNEIEILLQ